jgi:hypothetical protein
MLEQTNILVFIQRRLLSYSNEAAVEDVLSVEIA